MKITKATDIMTKDVVVATGQMPVTEVMEILLREGVSGLPIVDEEGMLQGIISEIDLVNSMLSGNAAETVASEIMSTNIISFPPEANCAEIASCFTTHRIRRVPILDQGKVVGIVSRADVLKHLLQEYNEIKSL